MAIDLSGLEHFQDSLKKTSKSIKKPLKNDFMLEKVELAENEIKNAYTGQKGIVVVKEQTENGFTIFAKDTNRKPRIAFDEFGTGYYAKGSYPGELPKQRLTFQVKGKIYSTMGWEYYYDNKETKRQIGGLKGWVTKNGTFHIGQDANATMYKACKRIIRKMKGD